VTGQPDDDDVGRMHLDIAQNLQRTVRAVVVDINDLEVECWRRGLLGDRSIQLVQRHFRVEYRIDQADPPPASGRGYGARRSFAGVNMLHVAIVSSRTVAEANQSPAMRPRIAQRTRLEMSGSGFLA